MSAWVQLTEDHSGKTAGAVLNERGTSFVPEIHRLVVICGDEKDAVVCDLDDKLKPSDLALGVIDLPGFLQ